MTVFNSRLLTTTALVSAVLASGASALTISPDSDAASLADTLFLNADGLSDIMATFSGNSLQAGTFTNDTGTYGLPNAGIVLSTGNVADYGDGPNTDSGNTTGFDSPATDAQNALLQPITGFDPDSGEPFLHNDVAQLSISFVAAADVTQITFFGTFGSEEFPEFTGSEFIDGFGLFVNGNNVAFAGESQAPINIDHPDFLGAFVDNGDGGDFGEGGFDGPFGDGDLPNLTNFEVDEVPINVSSNTLLEPGDPRLALVTGTELDGVIAPGTNPVLRFDVPVLAGQLNTFDIIIADTSDDILDSTIYLSSFQPTEVDLNDGSTEFTPLLPTDSDPNNGVFVFEIDDINGLDEIFFIDPPVSVGYTYTVTDAEFALVQAPSLATVADVDGYLLTYLLNGVEVSESIVAGAIVDLSAANVSTFTLSGIDTSLSLDPADPLAFPLGVSLQNFTANTVSISQVAITQDIGNPNPSPVPVPASLPMLAFGALSLSYLGRRRRKA